MGIAVSVTMRRLLGLVVALLLTTHAQVQAHLMPAQQGTLKVQDTAVFVAVALPVSALQGVDDDADGRLSEPELRRHDAAILRQIASRWTLTNSGVAGQQDLLQVLPQPDDDAPQAGSRHLLVLMKSRFSTAPDALRVQTDLFGRSSDERQLTLKALRTVAGRQETEAVVLTPGRTSHVFFRDAWHVLADFVVLGCKHILTGADHLLFLLTLVVVGAGWRHWLVVLTSFNLAHSLSMAGSLLGWVHVSPAVVEPLIAASIVLMAALNLRRQAVSTGPRAAVVLACGLLHGLGFAGAIADMGLQGNNQWLSVLGFNLGIELGQALCVATVLGAMALPAARGWPAGRLAPWAGPLAGTRVASVTALLVGSFWVVERLTL